MTVAYESISQSLKNSKVVGLGFCSRGFACGQGLHAAEVERGFMTVSYGKNGREREKERERREEKEEVEEESVSKSSVNIPYTK